MTTQPPHPPPPDPWGQQPQQHPGYQQPSPTPPPRPRHGVSLATPLAILIGCGLFFGGCLFGVAIGGAGNQTNATTPAPAAAATDTGAETTESSEPTETSKPATTKTTKPPATKPAPPTIGEGTWEVGSEVKPGTYTATVPADSNGCYWARLSGFSGSEIIDNDLSSAGQRARVTIRPSDKGFETQGCGTWTRTS